LLELIFKLPLDLFKELFCEFLGLSNIFLFDSAMTNKAERKIYLEKLIDCPIFTDYETMNQDIGSRRRLFNQIKIMTWITKREVLCKYLRIYFWNTTNLPASVLIYFNKQKTKNNLQSLAICAHQTDQECVMCPILIQEYCSELNNLEQLSLIGNSKKKYDNESRNFDPIIQIIATNSKLLKKIMLNTCSITSINLDLIANNCPGLEILQLVKCWFHCFEYNDQISYIRSFFCFFEKCLYLKIIVLVKTCIEIEVVTHILFHCVNLETIKLREIPVYNMEPLSCFKKVNRNNLKLKTVDISRNIYEIEDVCALFSKCPNLNEFVMENFKFCDIMAKSLSKNCLNILILGIFNTYDCMN